MTPKVHAMADGRRVPIKTLAKKMHVLDYDLPAPLVARDISPDRLTLPLKQSAGTPCLAKVKAGDRVSAGQVIGEPAPNALGAILHAPMNGVVREVNDKQIILEK
jgi:Na+-translocating ferredoxin:NAD+ oxidoreductase RnfC subunit